LGVNKEAMKPNQNLSQQEFSLIENTAIIHQKAAALSKIKQYLNDFAQALNENCLENADFAALALKISPPKVSRGENYVGLPYLVLDYPASYSQTSIFAFRTLFWWGNFFSFTLHLQGEALEKVRAKLLLNQELIKDIDFYICVGETPWQYHYESSNYKKASSLSEAELRALLRDKFFIKLSYKLNLKDYQALSESGLAVFEKLLALIT
jgi:hypothetical protein